MPRVIVIAEGLEHDNGNPRHQTVLSEQVDLEKLSGDRLSERLAQAIADAAAIEQNPPPQPIPADLVRRVRTARRTLTP